MVAAPGTGALRRKANEEGESTDVHSGALIYGARHLCRFNVALQICVEVD